MFSSFNIKVNNSSHIIFFLFKIYQQYFNIIFLDYIKKKNNKIDSDSRQSVAQGVW
jgi:hypothetical protein